MQNAQIEKAIPWNLNKQIACAEEIPRYEFCPADETILKKLRSGNAAR